MVKATTTRTVTHAEDGEHKEAPQTEPKPAVQKSKESIGKAKRHVRRISY